MSTPARYLLAALMALCAALTGTGAYILAGLLDPASGYLLITLAGCVGYAAACAGACYTAWMLVTADRR